MPRPRIALTLGVFLLVCVITFGWALHKRAGAAPARPDSGETQFITSVARTMQRQYHTAAAALRAGYMQMTPLNPDDHTSVYFNHRFDGVDREHPNFLWYDRDGILAGLDYEVKKDDFSVPPGTAGFPVARARWTTIPAHVHFAYTDASGKLQLAESNARPNLRGVIEAGELTKDGLLPAGAKLVWASYHPECWDLGFWLVPNPSGAFSDKNPLVR
jgi:hypothetical protein